MLVCVWGGGEEVTDAVVFRVWVGVVEVCNRYAGEKMGSIVACVGCNLQAAGQVGTGRT